MKGAAFGVACVHLCSRLNLTLLHAAAMLRGAISHMATENALKAAHGARFSESLIAFRIAPCAQAPGPARGRRGRYARAARGER